MSAWSIATGSNQYRWSYNLDADRVTSFTCHAATPMPVFADLPSP